jgi:hypothetical protein
MKRYASAMSAAALAAMVWVAGRAMADNPETTDAPKATLLTPEKSSLKPAADQTLSSNTAKNAAEDLELAAGSVASNKTFFDRAGIRSANANSSYSAAVAKTGQTPATPLNPAPAGSDGALQKGVAWPNPRFKDNANGTVKDNLTGLIWLKNANAFGPKTWAAALTDCNGLAANGTTLTDGSAAGDWRLPNRKELDSPIALQFFSPALCNTGGTGPWREGDPFTGVQSGIYWTSTSSADHPNYAWLVYLYHGLADYDRKTSKYYVWPVRGGP